MNVKERQLIERITRGERAAFEEFLDSYGPRVQRLARRYAGCEADTEDLMQEIFLDLYKSLSNFRGEAALSTWVYRVALNHCLRHQKKTTRHTAQPLNESDERPDETLSANPVRQAARGELRDQVQDALQELSPAQRTVVILHELHGLTYGECAQVLDVPVGTVKSRLSNAFRHLRTKLGGYVLGESEETTPAPLGEAA